MENSSFDKKYQLDTNENRAFLRAMTENLLAFGRRFIRFFDGELRISLIRKRSGRS